MKTSALKRRPSTTELYWRFLLVDVDHWAFLLVNVDHWRFLRRRRRCRPSWRFLLVDLDHWAILLVDGRRCRRCRRPLGLMFSSRPNFFIYILWNELVVTKVSGEINTYQAHTDYIIYSTEKIVTMSESSLRKVSLCISENPRTCTTTSSPYFFIISWSDEKIQLLLFFY